MAGTSRREGRIVCVRRALARLFASDEALPAKVFQMRAPYVRRAWLPVL